MIRTSIIITLLSLIAGILLYRNWPRPDMNSGTHLPPGPITGLEQREAERDRTIWLPEIRALKYGQVFVDLWDKLRNSTNAFLIARQFRFDELRLPDAASILRHENAIEEHRFGTPAKILSFTDWTALLARFEQDGFTLEQSEWRNPGFRILSNGIPESLISMTWHVSREASQSRWIVRANLVVQWRRPQPEVSPIPEQITVKDLQLLTKKGPLPFERIFSGELPSLPGFETLDPGLLVYDLNGDDRPEIVLGGLNGLVRLDQGAIKTEKLCAFPRPEIHASLFGDFNSDGRTDLLVADDTGLWLYPGDLTGHFDSAPILAWKSPSPLPNPFVLASGDIDNDGALDIWLSQYKLPYRGGQMPTPYWNANDGFSSFLLVNDGHGNFREETDKRGLSAKRFRRGYSCSFVDVDGDGDLDLVLISDFAGIDIFLNDGTGNFRESTSLLIDEPHAFGMALCVADFDLNGSLDILMAGMNSDTAARLDSMGLGPKETPLAQQMRAKMGWGNRLYLRSEKTFVETNLGLGIARSGWAWGASAFDFDNDGDDDVYIVNGHNSRATAADYESQFWRHDIYAGNSQFDAPADKYFQKEAGKYYGAGFSYGGYYKNAFFINENGTNFLEAAYLLGLAAEEDCRNLVTADLDGDGKLDVIFTTLEQWPEHRQTLQIYKNNTSGGHSISFPLQEKKGRSLPGVIARARLASGKRLIKNWITGDSYRSQHPAVLHFGLGTETNAPSIEFTWPGGKRETVMQK